MSPQLLASLLIVLMPTYEGFMVCALQHVANAMHTLPAAVVSTAQQFVEAVSHGEAQIEIRNHMLSLIHI